MTGKLNILDILFLFDNIIFLFLNTKVLFDPKLPQEETILIRSEFFQKIKSKNLFLQLKI